MVIKIKIKYILPLLFSVVICILILSPNTEKTVEASASVSIKLPIIMYHHITESKSKSGDYTVLKTEVEEDLKFIKENGYETVTVSDLIEFIEGKRNLPEKIIMITFDDGFESVYALAYPFLKEYKMKAVVSVIGAQADKYSKINDHNISYSNLTWKEIEELDKSDEVEIQSHTYNMHGIGKNGRKGLMKLKGEDKNKYINIIKNDLNRMKKQLKEKSDIDSTALIYPYGAYTETTEKIIKELGYKCTMTCEERVNTVTKGKDECLFKLGRFNRKSGISSEEFFEGLI